MNGQRYPQQKPVLGEFPRQNTGEIKRLYGCGISDKIPPQTHSSPPAEVMASSKRGNKLEPPLLFHCWSSCARVEPSALRLNQYKRCALQPRTCLFRLSVKAPHRAASTNGYTFPRSPWSDPPCITDRMGDFHPHNNQLKHPPENYAR